MLPVHAGTRLLYIALRSVCPAQLSCFTGPALIRHLTLCKQVPAQQPALMS